MLYCIHCEKTVQERMGVDGVLCHLNTIRVSNSSNPGNRWDVRECEFPAGYAYAPQPEFNMDAYMAEIGEPPFPIDMDFVGYDYDVETDQIVEVLI